MSQIATPYILILKIIKVESLARNQVSLGKDCFVDEIGDNNSEVGGAKSKNMRMLNSLAKFKLFVEPSFKAGFLTPGAWLVFTKLR